MALVRNMFVTLKKIVCILLLVALSPQADAEASANSPLPPDIIDFEHLTLEDGLANPVVYDIVKDRLGFLWFATGNGVSRYDGYEYTNYVPQANSQNSIGAGPVIQLYSDSKKQLWALVIGSGLYRFDEEQDTFVAFEQIFPEAGKLTSVNVYCMAEDKDGIFWVSTIDAGLNRIDVETGTVTQLRYQENASNVVPSDKIAAVLVDKENILWISSLDRGLIKYDIKQNVFSIAVPDLPQSLNIYEDRFGDIWVPTLGNGVTRYIRQENRFISYTHNPQEPTSLSHNQMVKVTEDSYGTLWLTSWGGGVNVFDRTNNTFRKYQHSPGRSKSLNNDNTWGIFVDNTNIVWIGTYGAGVNKYDRKTERFHIIRHNPSDPNSLQTNSIKTIFQDSQGALWFGTSGKGLSQYEPSTKKFTHFRHDPNNPASLSNNNIWAIAEDRAHDLWIATEFGLNKYERKTGRFIHYLHDPTDPDSPGSNLIRSILIDRNDNIWLGTQLVGIDRFDRKNNRFIHYDVEGPHNTVLFEDSKGNIWNGNAKAINRLSPPENEFKEIPLIDSSSGKRLKGIFTAINESEKGLIFLGTTNGLKILNPEDQSVRSYGLKDGLNDEAIADIQFEKDGTLWISTARGISVYQLEEDKFTNYDLTSFNRQASLLAQDGQLYFGGIGGVYHFHPERMTANKNPPSIVITEFSIANVAQKLDSTSSTPPAIELYHQDKLFSFEFSALDFSAPRKNRYRYKLSGFDQEWIEVDSKRRFASYTNLDAGKYTFLVTGSNNDGVWNPDPISVEITVVPPWWQSRWFYAFIVIAAFGCLGLIYQLKVRQLKKELLTSQKLRESEEKFRLIFENSPLGIVYFDHKGKATACNDLFCNIFGKNHDEVVLQNLLKVEFYPQMSKSIKRSLQGEIIHYEQKNVSFEGDNNIAIRAMYGPVFNSDKEISGGIGIVEDISEKLKAKQESLKLEAKLQQAMKMEAIGTLAGGIAHDFNNILSVILGYTDIAREDVKRNSQDKAIEDLGKINQAGIRAKELVKQILAFSRQSETERTLQDPSALVEETIKMLRPTIPTTISIQTEITTSENKILVNQVQMQQVVMNLCTNAFHAMEVTGGTLTIKVSEIELTKEDTLLQDNKEPGTYIRLIISDTGPGIPEEIQHRIFEPYFTTKEAGKGTGMGLAIVHGIVRSYGGFISLYSQLGQGTSIHVCLPVANDRRDHKVETEINLSGGGERILLVDDEKELVEMTKDMLTRIGYSVTGISDSAEALKIFTESPFDYDLIITDQTMPTLTGEELAREILSIRKDMPIILCTGYSSLVTEEKAKKLGIKAFALKPFVAKEITNLVRQVLDT